MDKISRQEFLSLYGAGKKKNKYNNTKIEYQGMKFDSKKEFNRYQELALLQLSGLITDLKRQVRFEICPKNGKEQAAYYVADFTYKEGGRNIIEDVKSAITKKNSTYILKRKLVKNIYKDYIFRES